MFLKLAMTWKDNLKTFVYRCIIWYLSSFTEVKSCLWLMMILKANHIPETHQRDHSVPFELMFFALLFLFCLVLISHLHMELFRGEILVETDFMRSDLSIPWKRWLLMSYFVFHLKCTRPCAWECHSTIGSTIHYRLVRPLVFP